MRRALPKETSVDIAFLVARIVFVLLFLTSGLGHLIKADMMAGYTKSKGVPFPKLATIVSGLAMVVGSLSIVLGAWGDIGSLLIVLTMLGTAFMMHNFWTLKDPMAKQGDQTQFLKDLSLAAGALGFFVVFTANPGLTLTSSLLSF